MVLSEGSSCRLTTREAKRVAIRIIIEAARSEAMRAEAAGFTVDPDSGEILRREDEKRVTGAVRELLAVLDRRAGRLRSFGPSSSPRAR